MARPPSPVLSVNPRPRSGDPLESRSHRDSPLGSSTPEGADRRLFLEAILAGKSQAALDIALGAIAKGADVRDVYVEMLQESLYEVGRLWAFDLLSLSGTHLATAATQFVVVRLYESLPRSATIRGRLLLTGVEGERHQIGGHMVSDALETDGWNVKFLGTDVLAVDVLEALSDFRPAILGISCMMTGNLPKVAFLIGAVREAFQASAPRIIVGGGAFRAAPEKASQLGADAWAPDMRAAIEVVRNLGPHS